MPIKDVLKVSRKTFFNPAAWLGYGQLKGSTLLIWSVLKSLVETPVAERQETFEEAKARLDLSDQALAEISQRYFLFALIFLAAGAISLGLGFYFLFIHKTFSGFLLGISAAALLLSQAFRYHFWHFQIVHRKLGCTFDEWLKGKINPVQETKP